MVKQLRISLLAGLALMLLAGCKFADESNSEAISRAAKDCSDRGFNSVSVTYIFGLASSYHNCFNRSE